MNDPTQWKSNDFEECAVARRLHYNSHMAAPGSTRERRLHPRVKTDKAIAKVRRHGVSIGEYELCDVSLGGAQLRGVKRLEVGDNLDLSLCLSRRAVRLDGEVVRSSGGEYGVQFPMTMGLIDAIETHLRETGAIF